MADTTYVLYGPGKDSSEVLGNFPTGLMKTAFKVNFLCPICVPVNFELPKKIPPIIEDNKDE